MLAFGFVIAAVADFLLGLAVRGKATVAPLMPAILREVKAVHDAETFDIVTSELCGVSARGFLTCGTGGALPSPGTIA